MNLTVPITLLGWIPAVLLLFIVLPAQRAVITAFLCAWLFLPMWGYQLRGLPDYTKMTATCYGVLIAVLIFDAGRLASWRPSLLDVPMAAYCVAPLLSSLANGLGWYDGISGMTTAVITWGAPYFIGRLYFGELYAMRELAIGIFVGGLLYVPLCLYEVRMSPQLHSMVYGFFQHDFAQTMRYGGWRPTVFMQHGLMVGAWMTAATVVGAGLWLSGSLRAALRVPMWALVMMVGGTAILCKSTGALLLMMIGLGMVWLMRRGRHSRVLLAVAALPVAYVVAKILLGWTGQEMVDLASMVSQDRAASLAFRLKNEQLLLAKAMEQPLTGWGGWGRSALYDSEGYQTTTPDGLWIIILGINGLLGLVSVYLVLLAPASLVAWRARRLMLPATLLAPALAVATVSLLFAVDTIPNAMLNPVFVLVCGGLASLSGTLARLRGSGRVYRSVGAGPALGRETVVATDAGTGGGLTSSWPATLGRGVYR